MKDNQTAVQANFSMSSLLDEYTYQRPKKGQFREAEIMQIDRDRILLDLGGKTDAVVTPAEMKRTDDDLLSQLSEGDTVPVYVLSAPRMLQKPTVSLQRGLEKMDWDRARDLMENKQLAKLKVIGKNKGGLVIGFGRLTGFLPASLLPVISSMRNRKLSEKVKKNLVGEELLLSIIEVNPKRKRLIFSGRQMEDQIRQRIFTELVAGETRHGFVVNLVDYGAFVDLLGAVGLLHISEIDWIKPSHPSDVLSLGDKIEVKILDVEPAEGKVSLSRKALLDPFNDYALEPNS